MLDIHPKWSHITPPGGVRERNEVALLSARKRDSDSPFVGFDGVCEVGARKAKRLEGCWRTANWEPGAV